MVDDDYINSKSDVMEWLKDTKTTLVLDEWIAKKEKKTPIKNWQEIL